MNVQVMVEKTEQTNCDVFQKDFGVHHESSENSEHKQTVLDKQQCPENGPVCFKGSAETDSLKMSTPGTELSNQQKERSCQSTD